MNSDLPKGNQSGAQTCITKAQLDAILVTMARTAAAEPMPATGTKAVEPAVIGPAIDEPAQAQRGVERAGREAGALEQALEVRIRHREEDLVGGIDQDEADRCRARPGATRSSFSATSSSSSTIRVFIYFNI